MHTNVNTLFENLWDNYLAVTPSADKIHDLLMISGNTVKLNYIFLFHITQYTFLSPHLRKMKN